MFRIVGAIVVYGFATYGFASWWRQTYNRQANSLGGDRDK